MQKMAMALRKKLPEKKDINRAVLRLVGSLRRRHPSGNSTKSLLFLGTSD